ncbi:MAG: YlmC/YmxH family sporulation protein [Firmicutes bacterium]|nr:YlmC/YmxH family sporulation protein [Dethiobacter sp.]MBS3888559.1 YlmC/YmxH family sporulation protein [Bacillota bacterium]MBS4054123.1 YlmC/YmxH family sporulation protein [Thermaerobacter sp.]
MLRVSDLREKEIVNILDGRRIGFIGDLDVDVQEGRIRALIVLGQGKLLGLFGRDDNVYIAWDKIVKIGLDVILVDMPSLETPCLEDELS